eukprot:GSChrysophyteH1.ASY1.ANO1.55.1 assembled CDS
MTHGGPTSDDDKNHMLSWKETILFTIFGFGPSWMVVACIYQEVPAFERYLPEQYCIAAYISLVISFSVAFIIFNLIYMHFFGPAPHSISVPFTMGLEIFAMFLAAAVWDVTTDKHSIMLFLCAWLGGGVGGLQMVLVMPWMSRFHPKCITAFRVGTDIGSLLSAVVALIQKPGSPTDALFGPSIYFAIFGSLMIFPVMAYIQIINGNYEFLDNAKKAEEKKAEQELDFHTDNPLNKQAETKKETSDIVIKKMEGQSQDVTAHTAQQQEEDTGSDYKILSALLAIDARLEILEAAYLKKAYGCVVSCFPNHLGPEKVPWLETLLPYMMAITWVDFNIFGFVFGVYPLAVKNATLIFQQGGGDDAQSQEAYMGYALQAAAVFYLFGDAVTFVYQFKVRYVIMTFTTCCFVVYAVGSSAFDATISPDRLITNRAVAPVLTLLYCIINFCAPYLLCICFREACSKPAPEHRESSARTLGLFDQASTVVGSVTLLFLVGGSSSCH